jgi:hypothetical protein
MTIEIVPVQGVKRTTKGMRVKSEFRAAIEAALTTLKNAPDAAARIENGIAFDVTLAGVNIKNPETAARGAGRDVGYSVSGEVINDGATLRVYVNGPAKERKPRTPKVAVAA